MPAADLRVVPFLPLPIELVREVIELAAHADTATGLSLALVSKAINAWVLPIIYRTVILDTREKILSFNGSIETAQCVSIDNSRHVMKLAIRGTATVHFAWSLSICGHVQQILLKPQNETDVENSIPLWPRPWHVILLRSYTDWIAPRLDFFAQTTHLYLAEGLGSESIISCLSLPLTHICIGCWEDEVLSQDAVSSVMLLLSVSSMRVVMIHAFISGHGVDDFFGGVWADLAEIPDERLVVAPGLSNDDLLVLFESGDTVWDYTEVHKDWRDKVRT